MYPRVKDNVAARRMDETQYGETSYPVNVDVGYNTDTDDNETEFVGKCSHGHNHELENGLQLGDAARLKANNAKIIGLI